MKIVTWNCSLNFSKKFDLLNSLNADVMIIQECEKLESDFILGYQLFWEGRNEKKGIAVIVRGSGSKKVEIDGSELAYFLPIETEWGLVLGVWAFNHRAKKFGLNISGYLVHALESYESIIRENTRVIVAGDFNNGPKWDLIKFHKNNFRHIDEELARRSFSSSYHKKQNEVPGQESFSTYFHQRNPDMGYHIDYVYSKGFEVSELLVGEFIDWNMSSDHVPLYVVLKAKN